MKERGILFSAPMVRALLEGRKTQTRRIITGKQLELIQFLSDEDNNDRPGFMVGPGHSGIGTYVFSENYPDEGSELLRCPYGQPGDRLWVRETWAWPGEEEFLYRASHQHIQDKMRTDPFYPQFKWRPSIYMPRWASRITLELTEVRVQRLQDISEEDAKAEGLKCLSKDNGRTWKWGIPDRDGWPGTDDDGWEWHDWDVDPGKAYARLWERINGAGSWAGNPWVWALTFKRVTP